jgi:ISXO2-like transposase domain
VRAVPVKDEKVVTLQPIIDHYIDKAVHLMSDGHRSYQKIGQQFSQHSKVTHSHQEFSRGQIHCNTAESFAALFERGRKGVFHYLSREHLSRYLHEFTFRWDNRVPETKKTKTGKKKTVMKPIPIIDMLILMIMRFSGKHLRRTQNWGFQVVEFNSP